MTKRYPLIPDYQPKFYPKRGYVPLGKRCPHGLDKSQCITCTEAREKSKGDK